MLSLKCTIVTSWSLAAHFYCSPSCRNSRPQKAPCFHSPLSFSRSCGWKDFSFVFPKHSLSFTFHTCAMSCHFMAALKMLIWWSNQESKHFSGIASSFERTCPEMRHCILSVLRISSANRTSRRLGLLSPMVPCFGGRHSMTRTKGDCVISLS